MGLFRFFGHRDLDVDTIEKELKTLSDKHQIIQDKIAELKKVKISITRFIFLFVAVSHILWILYLVKIHENKQVSQGSLMNFMSNLDRSKTTYLFAVPFGAYITVFILNYLVDTWIRSHQISLRRLQQKRSSIIKDLKDKTNYDATDGLLRKYERPTTIDDGKRSTEIMLKPLSIITQTTSASKQKPTSIESRTRIPQDNQKTFQDRILDLIIGSDHNESVESRYALICEKCFVHNGLAPPGCSDPATVKFICRRCGFLNGSQHAKDKLDEELAFSDHHIDANVDEAASLKISN